MTQYMLSVHHDADVQFDSEEMQATFDTVDRFNDQLRADGHWVFAGGLEAPETATSVDARGSEVLTTDGPYAESKEHLGGFWIIEAADLDAAMKLAEEASVACRAAIEVRPFSPA